MSKNIRLTRRVISNMFDECNSMYFSNKVERPIKFETWTPQKKIVGMVRHVYLHNRRQSGSSLHISRRYRWTEENLRNVVVHEMIHLAIEDYKVPLTFVQRLPLIGRFFIVHHNQKFIDMMNHLNEKYNLSVMIRVRHMKKDLI